MLSCCVALSSCQWSEKLPLLGKEKTTKFSIDASATILPAHYGKDYVLSGNVMARFPDFDLVKLSTTLVGEDHLARVAGQYDTYQLRSRDGKTLQTFTIGPENHDENSRVIIKTQSFLISGGRKAGSIRIFLPPYHYA